VNTQLSASNQLSTKVSGLEATTADKIAAASKHVEGRVNELDEKLEPANKVIAEQQVKLTSTNELVTAMFSKGRTEIFPTNFGDTQNLIVVAAPPGQSGAQVFMLLKGAPIFQTVQVQFYISVQPRYSYAINANVVVFNWGDPAEGLKAHPIEISYVPDPTYRGVVYSTLSVKEGHVLADGTQLR
jgi:hypothetical protein